MIVVVARKDLWRKEFDQMLLLKNHNGEKLPADYSKRKVCPQLLSENCTDSLF
jgi:hypothetical protein